MNILTFNQLANITFSYSHNLCQNFSVNRS